MRVHTIERIFPLAEVFSIIKNTLGKEYEIDENSYLDDLNLLIIAINIKSKSVIIRGSIDKPRNRFCFSILALQTDQILKEYALSKNTIEFTKSLGTNLYAIIKRFEDGNHKNFAFTNLKIEKSEERTVQIELIETEKEILLKILDSIREKYEHNDLLGKYPFSLNDMDGSWEMWYDVYNHYIDLIENKFISTKNSSLKLFRNYDFALENTHSQRIVDLILTEEEKTLKPILKNSGRTIKTLHDTIQNQNLDKVEKGIYNLRITFIFAHKKKEPLKLIQMLKLLGEVQSFTKLIHKKDFRRYNHIHSQIIFISLFGFEQRIENYLKDNPYGTLSESQSVLILPPINNTFWHNYFVLNLRDENEYTKSQSETNLTKYNKIRSNFLTNHTELRKMESQYNDIVESKKVSEHNYQEINNWAEILSINNCSELLDLKSSREKIIKTTS